MNQFINVTFKLFMALSCIVASTCLASDVEKEPSFVNDNYAKKLTHFTSFQDKQLSYEQFIDNYKIPGLSFTVVNQYKIIYTKVAGVKDSDSKEKIDKNTAFSTASIAKPVTATIAAMLAEQGKLSLDLPISHYLTRWKLPNSAFSSSNSISIRQLLAHTSGMSQGGYADFHLGDDIPTILEVLDGQKLPRYKSPITMLFPPDADWQYSGGGYVIVQVAIEDITGKSLQALAQEMIFKPLNMNNTTMYQNGDKHFLTNIAKVHDREQKVIRDGIPICPQIAPSGLWSTSEDMAKFTIEYQKALAGKKTQVISNFVARTTTATYTLKKTGGWAPGWMRFEGKGNLKWFSHGGSNTGTGGHIMSTMQGGKGIMIFMNATTEHRAPAIDALVNATIEKMNWSKPLKATALASSEQLNKISGRYLSPFDQIVEIKLTSSDNSYELMYSDKAQGNTNAKMYYQGNGQFALFNNPNLISVERHPTSQQPYLVLNNLESGLKEYAMRKLDKNELLPFEVASNADYIKTLNTYKKWKKNYPDSRFLSANTLNNAGYNALGNKNYDVALNFFKVYSHFYPNDANAFDSLAEAYLLMGDNKEALANYQHSLQLNPDNLNAKKMIKKLK
ncbi:beta-lactamase family protein [Thalassotalea sp. 1_MG-2023]|uniref:serine hydrolase n=1 Tax=Thalassotalea sp. 1_MG-2023 TaxID=3062680 RepID=UPI0026E28761|nr:serine hydrolase [Thalassotalea sp. 1_MG-2023]MDO6427681.1 beta-lactamase family protein [Thalassotalea sp. 1_MG-2023]